MRREIKLIILMFLLIVGPAVLLSLLAVRVLGNWQVVLQKQMEADAIRILDQAVAEWEGELRMAGGQDFGSRGWIEGVFAWEAGTGLAYPREESPVSTFIQPVAAPDASRKAAALLQQATAFIADGATNQARDCLVKVVDEADGARDPEEGFYYDLIALKKLADSSAGREKENFTNEILRRVLRRYDDLAPLQRELMVEWVEGEAGRVQGSGVGSWGSEDKRPKATSGVLLPEPRTLNPEPLLSSWRERMRGRALAKADRERIASEISTFAASLPEEGWVKGRVGGLDAIVGRGELAGLANGKPGRQILALQFTEAGLIAYLNQRFAASATNSGIRIRGQVAGGGSPGQNLTLASRRLPSPLESVSLEAVPADPRAFSENARLQSRLYRWVGLLLIISVAAGAWFIWRQASGEIREARERTDFAATVSHDLRTPLASMRMLAESLYMGNIGDEAKKRTFLGAIIKESDRLSRLTDRALYFIRYGQGALRYQFTEGNLASLVKDAADTFAVTVSRPVSISFSAPADLPLVRFDDGALEQVVFNLLDNAVKYTEKGKDVVIEVSVTARVRRPPVFRWMKSCVEEVVVSVKDHGTGMAPDEVRRVMKPYMRGRGAARHNARGVGLGLALCHHVVNAHGGRIEIESCPGSGTTFSVVLPAAG